MSEPRTHLAIDHRWSGAPRSVGEGTAEVVLVTGAEMAADSQGLVHGGFLFSLADHAAMLAVNDPLVVLSSASVEFLRPVAVGEEVIARAAVRSQEGRRWEVEAVLRRGDDEVFRGRFECVVPRRHVLAPRES